MKELDLRGRVALVVGAGAVLYLASAAEFMTGQVRWIQGGALSHV